MKKVKKFVSLVLAAVMVMAMAVTAFADGITQGTTGTTGTITVDNAKSGVNYTAYKIFDLKYSSNKTSYSYTITANSEWKDAVDEYAGTEGKGLSVSSNASNSGTYDVTITEGTFRAADFAKFLKSKVSGKTGKTLTNNTETGKVEVTGLELGYYFVDSDQNDALCNLTSTNPNATIHDKNDVPFDKVDNKFTVEIGDVVSYTITGKVPNTTEFMTYEYTITDKMSEGLTFNNDVVVKVDETELAKDKYDYTKSTDDKGFTLTIHVKDMQNQVGKEIKVTYTATVNENAPAKISNNEAKLIYSNDPTDSTKTMTITDKETVYSAKIVINKYETGDETKKLANAKFVLEDKGTNKYYLYNEKTNKIDWIADRTKASKFETTINGEASINGLKNGTYNLYEIEAPEGYNMLTEPIEVVINGNDQDVSTLSKKVEVANNKGSMLPSTGGIGTTIFYVLGGILVLGAAVVLVVRRRTEK